ncbi:MULTISPECIES: hypothetical protein [unclassified Mycobacterium]|uniref:hypothetical protein n=1 Tax=unclassified Mycobacterium TaxID=2642494 RepID=UPI0029C8D11A|nr:MULTISPECIES: hypothetical protein [unclassified Mycobacterium]
MNSTVDELDFTNVDQREHQWIDQQGTLWRWHDEGGHRTGGQGWQYWQEDECRWKWHGLTLHLFGPYRQATLTERIEDEGTHDPECFCDECCEL